VNAITRVRVNRMYESCERHTFFVELTNHEGFTTTPSSWATGSLYKQEDSRKARSQLVKMGYDPGPEAYPQHQGLSLEEARDRALTDAADWADFFDIKPDPFIVDGVEIKPMLTFDSYTMQREERSEDARNAAA
jgi:hypothetical protein